MKPTKIISKVKSIHLMEGKVHELDIYGFTGLILELESGKIVVHSSTDPMQQFSELKPENDNYEQIRALIAD